ncbi:protein of unknown function [Chryseobacterium sp. JV274]|nr:protein of unknown function [Chryseobacterium sp. JV274]
MIQRFFGLYSLKNKALLINYNMIFTPTVMIIRSNQISKKDQNT